MPKKKQPPALTPAVPDSAEGAADAQPDDFPGDFRLGRVIRERLDHEGSYLRLEKAIEEVVESVLEGTPERETRTIRALDRRKLKSIAEGKPNVVMSLAELRGLDAYLSRFAESLAIKPLFEQPDIIQGLAYSGQVTFLIGSRTQADDSFRINIGHSDVAGMNFIQRAIYGFTAGVRLDFQGVRMHKKSKHAERALSLANVDGLMQDARRSLVSLGSTRANPATEAMLCEMFGIPRYKGSFSSAKKTTRPPFRFCWSDQHANVLPSHFHLTTEEVQTIDPDFGERMREHGAAAFEANGQIILDEMTFKRDEEEGAFTYGVCVAQKRATGQIWLVVSGLTGPSTVASSRWTRQMSTALHAYGRNQQSPVFWCFVRARAQAIREDEMTDYRVTGEEMLGELHSWTP